MADAVNAVDFLEVSAKTYSNVDEAFRVLAKVMMISHTQATAAYPNPTSALDYVLSLDYSGFRWEISQTEQSGARPCLRT